MSALPQDELARRAEALAERVDLPQAESWKPTDPGCEHPQRIVGVLESIEAGPDFGYGPKNIATLCTPEGKRWAVFLFHQVLAEEFDRLKPQIGELIAIRYEGRIRDRGQGASGFEKYRLVVDREAGTSTFASAPASDTPADQRQPEHADGVADEQPVCPECNFAEDNHAAGCPNEIPF